MKRNVIFVFAAVLALQCFGWGQKGHDTTCDIAEQHLSKKTKKHIASVLDGKSIVYYSNWMDNASNTPEYAYSKTWHYKNIDADQTYETAPVEPKGNVENKLAELINKIKNGNLTKAEEQEALKMVVHMVGDLHQPMHIGHKSDRGGNNHYVTFFGSKTNLHSLWDSGIVESAHKWSHNEWTKEIDRLTKIERKELEKGTLADWGKETYLICKDLYETTPLDARLSYDYVSKWTPTIEQQFVKGGIRLALVLNYLYDKKYKKKFQCQ